MSDHIERQFSLGDISTSTLKVAFASADLKRVDQHFGSCESLMIYGVQPERADLLQVTEFRVEPGHSEDKLASRTDVIADCFAVFCVAVGESAFRQLLASGIRAIRVDNGTPISLLIRQLQQEWPAQSGLAERQQKRRHDKARLDTLASSCWEGE